MKITPGNRTVWIYGPIPPPHGGISTFIQRLLQGAPEIIGGIIDPYFSPEKIKIATRHIRPSGPGWAKKARTVCYLRSLRSAPILFNASTTKSVILLAPFLVKRKAPSALLLHHGRLKGAGSSNLIGRQILKHCLSQIDFLLYESESHLEFYENIGISKDKLIKVDYYLPPSYRGDEARRLPDSLDQWLRTSDAPVIIGSGYARDYYHHDWPLDALVDKSGKTIARYALCCYGPESAHLDVLRSKFQHNPDAYLSFGLNPAQFDALLDRADIYVRPTSIDSFGIALHDAIGKGLRVIASKACARPPQTFLHDIDDKTRFLELTKMAILSTKEGKTRNSSTANKRPIHSESRTIIEFLRQLAHLQR